MSRLGSREQSNRRFSMATRKLPNTPTLTKAQKRVLIAKDVLKWIRAGAIKTRSGVYVHETRPYKRLSLTPEESLQSKVQDLVNNCEFCALGALFIGAVDKFNKIEVPCGVRRASELSGDAVFSSLEKWFSRKQLDQIESAFEGWGHDTFFMSVLHPCTQDRLKAICLNIVRNKGTFVLVQESQKAKRKGLFSDGEV